jgi:hypothetical protein
MKLLIYAVLSGGFYLTLLTIRSRIILKVQDKSAFSSFISSSLSLRISTWLIKHQAVKGYEETGAVDKHKFIISAIHTSNLSTPHFGKSAVPYPLGSRRDGKRRKTGQDMRGKIFLPTTGIEILSFGQKLVGRLREV